MQENQTDAAVLIERLIHLEYTIRQSIAVREDQEDNADPHQVEEAKRYRIHPTADMTKGDLLNAVQTLLRALQAQSRDTRSHAPNNK